MKEDSRWARRSQRRPSLDPFETAENSFEVENTGNTEDCPCQGRLSRRQPHLAAIRSRGSWSERQRSLTRPNFCSTTEPDLDFDITKSLAFQGTPVLDFSASADGMSLYIEANGRAINSRGEIILLAEGMTDRMVIKPTEDYGLAIRSGGDGVDRSVCCPQA